MGKRTLEVGGEIDFDHRSVTIKFESGIRREKERERRGKVTDGRRLVG